MRGEVLVVEDDPGDQMLIEEAFAEVAPSVRLRVVSDARSALEAARQTRPGLVLLDLNLPGFSGLDALAVRRDDAALMRVPFVVFTTSSSPTDVGEAYARGANAVVTKPATLEAYLDTVGAIERFWLGVCVGAP